eukprot:m.893142 g.893142  ORF g.893142 m.893142 type:complete len:496 (-) comp23657_c0_seq11:1892-3379(-)
MVPKGSIVAVPVVLLVFFGHISSLCDGQVVDTSFCTSNTSIDILQSTGTVTCVDLAPFCTDAVHGAFITQSCPRTCAMCLSAQQYTAENSTTDITDNGDHVQVGIFMILGLVLGILVLVACGFFVYKYCGGQHIADDESTVTKPHPLSSGTRLAPEVSFEPEWDDEMWSSALKLQEHKTETEQPQLLPNVVGRKATKRLQPDTAFDSQFMRDVVRLAEESKMHGDGSCTDDVTTNPTHDRNIRDRPWSSHEKTPTPPPRLTRPISIPCITPPSATPTHGSASPYVQLRRDTTYSAAFAASPHGPPLPPHHPTWGDGEATATWNPARSALHGAGGAINPPSSCVPGGIATTIGEVMGGHLAPLRPVLSDEHLMEEPTVALHDSQPPPQASFADTGAEISASMLSAQNLPLLDDMPSNFHVRLSSASPASTGSIDDFQPNPVFQGRMLYDWSDKIFLAEAWEAAQHVQRQREKIRSEGEYHNVFPSGESDIQLSTIL